MTVYMVIANNGMTYDYVQWNEEVFASKESADKYIFNRTKEHSKDNERMREIEKILFESARELTDSKIAEYDEEYDKLCYKWPYDNIKYFITPYDVRE